MKKMKAAVLGQDQQTYKDLPHMTKCMSTARWGNTASMIVLLQEYSCSDSLMFNRPGVAGAVLQTAL